MTDNTNPIEDIVKRVFNAWKGQTLVQALVKTFPADNQEMLDTLLQEAFEAGALAAVTACLRSMHKHKQETGLDAALQEHINSNPVAH